MRVSSEQNRVIETLVHPVQLQFVTARELFIKLYRPLGRDYVIPEADVRIESAASAYDAASRTVQVSVQAMVGPETEYSAERLAALLAGEGVAVRLRVLLVGQFKVDSGLFPLEQLDEWTAIGAPLTLYPYLREEVSALTSRCGISPLILPLLQVPTIQPMPGLSGAGGAGAAGPTHET